jgi:hypothetical protein
MSRHKRLVSDYEIRALLRTINTCGLSISSIDVRIDGVTFYTPGPTAPMQAAPSGSVPAREPTKEEGYAFWKSQQKETASGAGSPYR